MSATARDIFAPDLLADKKILITGGGTGLGRGVAAHLVRCGAEVCLWGRREAVLAEAAEEIAGGCAGAAHYQTVDVRESGSVDAAVNEIWERHGPLTGLLNNAAANFIAPTATLSQRAFEAVTSEGDSGPDEFIPELIDLHRQRRFPIHKMVTAVPFRRSTRQSPCSAGERPSRLFSRCRETRFVERRRDSSDYTGGAR
ncbi:MAG: hypothetical protein QOD39_1822 [Mycobacterium sp.]|nr:hypothetical protein [Mycobacterium sp.]